MQTRPLQLLREEAEGLAIACLGAIAGAPEVLVRFLDETGLTPNTLRQAAADPRFLAAVLAFVSRDERLLLDMAERLGIPPQRLGDAARHLAPEPPG